jgi:hypothetical protein
MVLLLVYANGVNILGGSVYAIKKNTEALVVVSKEIGLEVKAAKTKYKVMSRDPLKVSISSNVREKSKRIKILFRK